MHVVSMNDLFGDNGHAELEFGSPLRSSSSRRDRGNVTATQREFTIYGTPSIEETVQLDTEVAMNTVRRRTGRSSGQAEQTGGLGPKHQKPVRGRVPNGTAGDYPARRRGSAKTFSNRVVRRECSNSLLAAGVLTRDADRVMPAMFRIGAHAAVRLASSYAVTTGPNRGLSANATNPGNAGPRLVPTPDLPLLAVQPVHSIHAELVAIPMVMVVVTMTMVVPVAAAPVHAHAIHAAVESAPILPAKAMALKLFTVGAVAAIVPCGGWRAAFTVVA